VSREDPNLAKPEPNRKKPSSPQRRGGAEKLRRKPKSKPESAEVAESAEKTTSDGADGFCQFLQEFDSVGTDVRGSESGPGWA